MSEETAKWLLIAVSVLFLILLTAVIPTITANYKQKIATLKSQNDLELLKRDGFLKDKDLQLEKLLSDAKQVAIDLAAKNFEEWKEKELQAHRAVIIEGAIERAKAMLAAWKIEEEKNLRKDAVTRSMGVNFGKITEHLIPFSNHLAEFDPRDVRFIGSPVDLMIFSGATAKKSIIDIYFVEIKTGSGKLSKKQKAICEAIENNRIHWKPIVVPEFEWDVPDDDEEETNSQEYEANPPKPPFS